MKKIFFVVLDVVIVIVFPFLNKTMGRTLLGMLNWEKEICDFIYYVLFIISAVYFGVKMYWCIFMNGKEQLKEEEENFEKYQSLGVKINYCEIFLKQLEEYRISIENAKIGNKQDNDENEDNIVKIRKNRLELIKSLARIYDTDIKWSDLHIVEQEDEEKNEKQIMDVQKFIHFMGDKENIKEKTQEIDKGYDEIVLFIQRQIVKWEEDMKKNNLKKSSWNAKIAAFFGLG